MPESLRLLTNALGPIQYVDPQYLEIFKTIGKNKSSDIFSLGIILWEISSGNPPFEMESLSNVDLLNNILKGKREMVTPGTPSKYKEIYTDCWKHNGNSRPDISQVVKNLSELIISDAIGTPRSQPRNVTNGIISVKLEKQNIQNEESKVHSDPLSVDKSAEVKVFIKDLFEFFIGLYEKQDSEIHPIMIKNYIRKHKKNPVEILCEIISHPSHSLFTSLIGFFYKNGVVENKKEAFKWYLKAAVQGNSGAQYNLGNCLENGNGINKDQTEAFEWYKKAAECNYIYGQYKVGKCFYEGSGTKKDIVKAIYWLNKAKENGYIDANRLLKEIIK
ncbi:hypothetical protein Glove_130g155 [Diversispora epigaea]|uniref:Protein kinase domain-containing protein n=1 Tax=Diversispora epigaea TaxID=1348612 RepID=A0A397J6Z2_9GLOM|nr:hypothetical protein Glove_130g155 [Diversispora epigaea]